jgi:hypothetical protein
MAEQRPGWVSAPHVRGTITVLFSCIKALLIPLYSSFHVDIPAHPTSALVRLTRRLNWVLVGLVMPEIIVVLSLAQNTDARATRSSGLFKKWTLTHGFYIVMGGFVLVSKDGSRRTATFSQLVRLNETHPSLLAPISGITKEDISDRSKSDALVKVIALAQVVYLLGQLIGRAVQGLPVTPLEIATVAYVPIAALIYVAWWSKPQDVALPTEIDIGDLSVDSIPDWPVSDPSARFDGWRSVVIHRMQANAKPSDLHLNGFAFLLASIFGGIHLASWNFDFPTHLEQRLWRLAAIFALICGASFHILANTLRRLLQGKFAPKREDPALAEHTSIAILLWLYDYLGYLLLPMYAFSRVYIIFEAVYSLRSLPSRAFDLPSWVQYIPS